MRIRDVGTGDVEEDGREEDEKKKKREKLFVCGSFRFEDKQIERLSLRAIRNVFPMVLYRDRANMVEERAAMHTYTARGRSYITAK